MSGKRLAVEVLIDLTQALLAAHNGLFDSPSHRRNMMTSGYAENGMGVRFGQLPVA